MTKIERIRNWNDNFYKWNNFDQNGDTWVVLGNTYEIKDELKKLGAKFSRELGWHFNKEVAGYQLVRINVVEVAEKNFDGKIFFKEDVEERVNKIRKELEVFKPTKSEFVGEVGGRYSGRVILKRAYYFQGAFGYTGIFNFEDEDGNTIVWKTSADREFEENTIYQISGKIKEHSEYRGDKQTVLTRCDYHEVGKLQ